MPTDCPQRDERVGWTADTQVFAPAGAYLADVYASAMRRRFATSTGGAKLYSFWTGGTDGRSGGYLAGGSPESATLRDESKR